MRCGERMRKLLTVSIKDKTTGEVKTYHDVYDFGHFWGSEAQYFRVLIANKKDSWVLLEPRHNFVITIEEDNNERKTSAESSEKTT